MHRQIALLLPLLLLAAAGCNEQTLIRPGVTAVLYQSPPTEVDILLIVDDSCSMADEQDELSEGFDRFVEFFDVADVDYHIGVVTTDMLNGNRSGRLVESDDGVTVITRSTDDAADVFGELVQVGTGGAGYEQGLDAAAAALSDELLDDENEGFLREDALLSVIFVSDEEDASPWGVNSYVNFFRGLKDERQRGAFNASALVGVDPDTLEPAACGQSSFDPNAGAFASFRYSDVAVQTGGVVGSICDSDFADIVAEMGLASSRLLDEFALDRRPREETLEMTIELAGESEVDLPPEGTDDGEYPWEYSEDEDQDLWLIRFTDLTSLPPIGSKIVLHYELF